MSLKSDSIANSLLTYDSEPDWKSAPLNKTIIPKYSEKEAELLYKVHQGLDEYNEGDLMIE